MPGWKYLLLQKAKANYLHLLIFEKTQTIANATIHVERVIGSLRQNLPNNTYNILGVSDNTTTLDKIVAISSYLVNLCLSVVPLE